jgi:betaine reductase
MASLSSSSGTPNPEKRKEGSMVEFKDRLVLALGERDGVPAPALAKCVESAGGRVIYAATQCFA